MTARGRAGFALVVAIGAACSSSSPTASAAGGLNLSGSWTYRDSTAIRYLYITDGTEVRAWQVHYGPETMTAAGSGTWSMNGTDSILSYDSTESTPHPTVAASGPFARAAVITVSNDSLWGLGASAGGMPLSGVSSTVIQGSFASPPLAPSFVCPGYSGFAQAGSLQCTEVVKLTKK